MVGCSLAGSHNLGSPRCDSCLDATSDISCSLRPFGRSGLVRGIASIGLSCVVCTAYFIDNFGAIALQT